MAHLGSGSVAQEVVCYFLVTAHGWKGEGEASNNSAVAFEPEKMYY